MSDARLMLCRIALPLFLGVLGSCSSHWEQEALPTEFKNASLLVSSEQAGLREGCRSAVYRLPDGTTRKVAANGLGFFSRSGGEPNYRWRETPGEIDFANNGQGSAVTFHGLYALNGCDNRSDQRFHSREIGQALQQPGSYYLSGGNRDQIVVVVPRLGLLGYYAVG